ncbi:hypothetical protein F5Y18DRAFT_428923 [Xylariaceae sp. FL1019]|nr:hypothetical protein F5Y18DRAFT_428923 [Xylariaceae sp. FL1019]
MAISKELAEKLFEELIKEFKLEKLVSDLNYRDPGRSKPESGLDIESAIQLADGTIALMGLACLISENIATFVRARQKHDPQDYRLGEMLNYRKAVVQIFYKLKSLTPDIVRVLGALGPFQSFDGDLDTYDLGVLLAFYEIRDCVATCNFGIRLMHKFFEDINKIDIGIMDRLRKRCHYAELQVWHQCTYNDKARVKRKLKVEHYEQTHQGNVVIRIFESVLWVADSGLDDCIKPLEEDFHAFSAAIAAFVAPGAAESRQADAHSMSLPSSCMSPGAGDMEEHVNMYGAVANACTFTASTHLVQYTEHVFQHNIGEVDLQLDSQINICALAVLSILFLCFSIQLFSVTITPSTFP